MSENVKPPGIAALSLDAIERIDDICLRFEESCQTGSRLSLTECLGATDESLRLALFTELLKIELYYRRQSGETPRPDEYTSTFAQFAEAIRGVFESASDTQTTAPHTHPRYSGEADGAGEFPEIIGYKILSELGKGGMGVVYRAEQVSLGRTVALKTLRRAVRAEERARFQHEAQAMSRLKHDHIVQVHEYGVDRDVPFICMELVEGGSLDHYWTDELPTPRRAAELVAQLADAAHYAHQNGIIHRDLKPANVLMCDGSPKITDFGLAKWAEASAHTQTGDIFGTPAYMAPEQASGKGKDACPQTDVYALGAILYELLVGKPPFAASNQQGILNLVLNEPPVEPRRVKKEIHPDLEAVCLKCLEKSPARRYATAQALADDLRAFLGDKPTKARPRRWDQKAARWVAEHPLLVSGLILAILTGAAVPFARERLDPERPRKNAKALLAKGRPFVFEGTEPLPGPFRRILTAGSAPKPNPAEGCFSVEAVDRALVELLDEVPANLKGVRLTAEVRHDNSTRDSAVGLYFGYRAIEKEAGVQIGGLHALVFADRGDRARGNKDGKDNPTTEVQFCTRLFESRPAGTTWAKGGGGDGLAFRPALPAGRNAGPWRTLRVEVFANRAKGMWKTEDKSFKVVDSFAAKTFEAYFRDTQQHRHLADIPAQFKSHGGLGLYVFSGEASFRRITVEPVGDE